MKLFRNCFALQAFVLLPLLLASLGRNHITSAQWGNQQTQQQPQAGYQQAPGQSLGSLQSPPGGYQQGPSLSQQSQGGYQQSPNKSPQGAYQQSPGQSFQGGYQQAPGQSQGTFQQQLAQGAVAYPQMNPQEGYYILTYPQGSSQNPNIQGSQEQQEVNQWQQGSSVMNPAAGTDQSMTADDKQTECTNQPRIAGGMNAQWNDAPFMVSLREISKDQHGNFGLGHFCGGTLISPYFVLTAASCLINRNPYDVGVVVGTLNRRKNTAHSTQLLFVEKFITQPMFSFENADQDIGLIFLKQAVRIEPHSKTASLAWQDPRAGSECMLFGWGQTSRHLQYLSECLQVAKVKVQDLQKCQQYFEQRNIKIPQMSFCAGHYGGGSDACFGDMGGPLICDGVLHGIINNRIGCGDADVGKVYTNVYSFRNWIAYSIKSLQNEYKEVYPTGAFDTSMRKDTEETPQNVTESGSERTRISMGLIAAAGLSVFFV